MAMDTSIDHFLDEAFLRKLEQLRLLAQRGLRGTSTGEHLTRKSGASLEFLDYRNYQIGDDLRYVDWNAYGRLDKLFIKLFHADRDMNVHILIDMSESMQFGSPSKNIFAKRMVAALSYIGLANMDRVGVTSFGQKLKASKAPEKGKQVYIPILRYLQELQPEGQTDFNTSLQEYANQTKKSGIAIIISDLLDPQGIEAGLSALRYAKFDTTVIQILDHEELFPSQKGHFQLQDMETGELKSIPVTHHLLERYQVKMEGFLKNIKLYCLKNQIDYHLFDTKLPFEDFLLDYLSSGTFVR